MILIAIPWRYDKLFQRRNHLHRMGEKFIHKALLKKHENTAENWIFFVSMHISITNNSSLGESFTELRKA